MDPHLHVLPEFRNSSAATVSDRPTLAEPLNRHFLERRLSPSHPVGVCACSATVAPHTVLISEAHDSNAGSWYVPTLHAETPFRLTDLPLAQSLEIEYTRFPYDLTDTGLRLMKILSSQESIQDITIAPFAIRASFAGLCDIRRSRETLLHALIVAGCSELSEASTQKAGF